MNRQIKETFDFLEFEQKLDSLKNTKNYFPKNSEETRKFLLESYKHGKPTFISLKQHYNLK